MTDINEAIKTFFDSYKCSCNVIDDLLKHEKVKDFDSEFSEFKNTVELALKNNCTSLPREERLKCAKKVSKVCVNSYDDFLSKVRKTNWQLADKIDKTVYDKCEKSGRAKYPRHIYTP